MSDAWRESYHKNVWKDYELYRGEQLANVPNALHLDGSLQPEALVMQAASHCHEVIKSRSHDAESTTEGAHKPMAEMEVETCLDTQDTELESEVETLVGAWDYGVGKYEISAEGGNMIFHEKDRTGVLTEKDSWYEGTLTINETGQLWGYIRLQLLYPAIRSQVKDTEDDPWGLDVLANKVVDSQRISQLECHLGVARGRERNLEGHLSSSLSKQSNEPDPDSNAKLNDLRMHAQDLEDRLQAAESRKKSLQQVVNSLNQLKSRLQAAESRKKSLQEAASQYPEAKNSSSRNVEGTTQGTENRRPALHSNILYRLIAYLSRKK
jgi:hypothetical protein